MNTKSQRFLIPKKDTRVVDPATGQALPASGRIVRGNNIHWLRRLSDGDVSEAAPPSASAPRATRRTSAEAPSTAATKASQE